MIDVTSVTSHAEALVTITVSGAPPLKATCNTRYFQPELITVKYVYKPQREDDGWVHHIWAPTDVMVTGPRILKPAADGSQRLGVDWLRYFPCYGDEKPEWLTKIINELTPSGDIALAGS